jgi:hypothetical protein
MKAYENCTYKAKLLYILCEIFPQAEVEERVVQTAAYRDVPAIGVSVNYELSSSEGMYAYPLRNDRRREG